MDLAVRIAEVRLGLRKALGERYQWGVPTGCPGGHAPHMKKRLLAGILWFYAGWYAWAMVASLVHLPDVLGPLVGLVTAAFVVVDPLRFVWKSPRTVLPAPTDA